MAGLPGRQLDERVACLCVLGWGQGAGRGGCVLYHGSGRLPARTCCVQPARSEFSLERILRAAVPLGTLINEDINGQTQIHCAQFGQHCTQRVHNENHCLSPRSNDCCKLTRKLDSVFSLFSFLKLTITK